MTKHAAAPRLQPEKMRMRSHLLTRQGVSSGERKGDGGRVKGDEDRREAMSIGEENGEMREGERE